MNTFQPPQDHPLLRMLRSLHLPPNDYVIFGSGPLLAHGLRTTVGDLDVVARGPAWDALTHWYPPTSPPSGHGHMLRLVIEVTDRWLPGWDTKTLIDNADHLHGLPFASLADVRRSKHQTRRPKDERDLLLLNPIPAPERTRPT